MKEMTEFLMTLRHLKPEDIQERMEKYRQELLVRFPHDETFGKFMKNN